MEIQRNTSIIGGTGIETMAIDDSTFHGTTRLFTGHGADTIEVDSHGGPLGPPTRFEGPLLVLMRAGDDTLRFGIEDETGNRTVFSDDTRLEGGEGYDRLLDFDSTTIGNARFWVGNFETTNPAPDVTDPIVSATVPVDTSQDVSLNKKITATFSEAMDPLTITTASVTVSAPGVTSVAGTVDYVGTTMTFTPTLNLDANTVYSVTISTAAKDLAGNPLASNYTWSFTTGATADTTAPTVSSTDPASNATGVALNKKIASTFSEAMDASTITTANVFVTGPGGVPVAGTVAYVGNTMTFTPSNPLASSTLYTTTITTGAEDLAGNRLASNYAWSFTTGASADTTPPTVTSTDPANNATAVALNKKITAAFSESMDATTITTANVTLMGPGGISVQGTVAYVGVTMTFTPASPLVANSLYTASITTGAKDLAENPLANNFVWTFTTGATADVTAPTVTSTNPTNSQTNVFINKLVTGTFSESMDPVTLTSNFAVAGPGTTPVTGTVTYDSPSHVITFTPTSNLAINTTFTATIHGGLNGAKDLAGNALAVDKVWTFTTGNQIAQPTINLGRAGAFAILARAAVAGSGNSIVGDVGLNPGSAQGIPPSEITGSVHVDDQTVMNAQTDLLAAYNDAASRTTTSQTLPGNMGGLTFTPGLYTNSSSVLISGAGANNNVTLDAQGDPNAIFIFKMGTTLTTGVGTHVILTGGAKAGNVFWQVGTSATIDTTNVFEGNILAATTITVNSGSSVVGRLLAGSTTDGSVTVNGSSITVPAP